MPTSRRPARWMCFSIQWKSLLVCGAPKTWLNDDVKDYIGPDGLFKGRGTVLRARQLVTLFWCFSLDNEYVRDTVEERPHRE